MDIFVFERFANNKNSFCKIWLFRCHNMIFFFFEHFFKDQSIKSKYFLSHFTIYNKLSLRISHFIFTIKIIILNLKRARFLNFYFAIYFFISFLKSLFSILTSTNYFSFEIIKSFSFFKTSIYFKNKQFIFLREFSQNKTHRIQ